MVDLEGRILVEFNKWSKSMELLWQDSYAILSLKDKFLDSLYNDTVDLPGDSDGKKSAFSGRDPALIPVLERSPGERNGNPL